MCTFFSFREWGADLVLFIEHTVLISCVLLFPAAQSRRGGTAVTGGTTSMSGGLTSAGKTSPTAGNGSGQLTGRVQEGCQ